MINYHLIKYKQKAIDRYNKYRICTELAQGILFEISALEILQTCCIPAAEILLTCCCPAAEELQNHL